MDDPPPPDASAGDVRVSKPRRAAPADAVRPTRAEVNLSALRHNLHAARSLSGAPGADRPRVWGVLKADGYGHGAPAVARTLERAGIDGFCVALLEEGIELREAGIVAPILVMGGYYGPLHRGLEDALEHRLTPVLYEPSQVERLQRIASTQPTLTRGARPELHFKVDTGMGRLGCTPADVGRFLDEVVASPGVRLSGLMSHFATADDPDPSAALAQLAKFREVATLAESRGLRADILHIANSAGAIRLPQARFDAARFGLVLYGIEPCQLPDGAPSLRPTMRVRTEIVALRTIPDGGRVGYGHTWVARGDRVVATIPMGYADGLSRALSNRGEVLVRGRRAKIAGIVSMDLTTVDVTDVPGVALGDEVVVLGAQEAEQITAEEIAGHMGTIPWEVITSISRRVPRFYREP
jgi:alanine racemase